MPFSNAKISFLARFSLIESEFESFRRLLKEEEAKRGSGIVEQRFLECMQRCSDNC